MKLEKLLEVITGLTALILVGFIANTFKDNIESIGGNIPILIPIAFPLIAGTAIFLSIVLSPAYSLTRVIGLLTLVCIPILGA